MTDWLANAARCRRLAKMTPDERARNALLALAAELDGKVAEARSDPGELPERGGKASRPAD